MIGYFLVGLILAGLLLMLLNWWANADVKSAKGGLMWAIIAVCGVLALLLIATGKGLAAIVPAAFAAFKMFGPSILPRFGVGRGTGRSGGTSSRADNVNMSRSEALEVLGLEEGTSKQEINAAYKRLMAQLHPDKGGSDWMAAKLNDARRVLIEK